MHAHGLTAGQKTVENLDRAAGPSWAVGRGAAGPLGRTEQNRDVYLESYTKIVHRLQFPNK